MRLRCCVLFLSVLQCMNIAATTALLDAEGNILLAAAESDEEPRTPRLGDDVELSLDNRQGMVTDKQTAVDQPRDPVTHHADHTAPDEASATVDVPPGLSQPFCITLCVNCLVQVSGLLTTSPVFNLLSQYASSFGDTAYTVTQNSPFLP